MSLDNTDLAKAAVLLVQGGAAINKYAFVTQFTTVTNANNACTLPTAPVIGKKYEIRNDGVSPLQIFPQAGGTIDTLAVNTAYSLSSGNSVAMLCTGALTWMSLQLSSPGPDTAFNAAMTALAGGAQPTVAANMIPAGQFFTQITICATAKDSVGLPAVPFLNWPYVVMNKGATTAAVWPGDGVAASTINSLAANTPMFLGAGASMSFVAVAVSAAGIVTWMAYGYVGPVPILLAGATRTLTANEGMNGAIIQIAQAGADAAAILTLPTAAASNAGCKYKFVMTAGGNNNTVTIRATGATTHKIAVTRAATTAASVNLYAALVDLVYAAANLSGAWSEHICDGTNYYCFGFSPIATGFTAA